MKRAQARVPFTLQPFLNRIVTAWSVFEKVLARSRLGFGVPPLGGSRAMPPEGGTPNQDFSNRLLKTDNWIASQSPLPWIGDCKVRHRTAGLQLFPSIKNVPVSTTMNSFYAGAENFDAFVNNFALTIHGLFALINLSCCNRKRKNPTT